MNSVESIPDVSNRLVKRDGIYYLEGHAKFHYSDGDQAENYLLRSLRQCADLSSDSLEVEGRIKDWVSRYHLSRSRSLAYQSLEFTPDLDVLEIGSGAGAITRLLGERAGTVLALEGSERRAAITRERTRDQENVSVLCGSLEHVEFTRQYDVVICNGVLEYASLFMSGDVPEARMLDLLYGLVGPGGSLVLAIENQLGLRYFASSREEHTGVLFDGIEGYARHPRGPKTFGRRELVNLISDRFRQVEVLLPLPDYKFPKAVIREALLGEVDCAEILSGLASGRSGAATKPHFHERLAWHQVARNGMAGDLSNSFMVIAGDSASRLISSDWMGDIFATARAPEWRVRTRVLRRPDGVVFARKSRTQGGPPPANEWLSQSLNDCNWVGGESVHTLVSRAMLSVQASSLEERLAGPVSTWWGGVMAQVGQMSASNRLDGKALDLNWENSIVVGKDVHFIDREWELGEEMSPVWLMYRVVAKFTDGEWDYRHRWARACRGVSRLRLVKAACNVAGVPYSLRSVWSAVRLEARLQDAIMGRARSPLRVLLEDVAPFGLIHGWRECASRLAIVRGRIARNVVRLTTRGG